ncbi:hypothetical protein CLF_112486 [Clonorchis sinensis]|uniref:Uncharacterized protein n=1 Tax=Clonorchis sinensis TaxID=79923 RepID=G7YMJ6_CLOSI|nr:hypothetical protein CLF_112486 [Clonorchis sinensis]
MAVWLVRRNPTPKPLYCSPLGAAAAKRPNPYALASRPGHLTVRHQEWLNRRDEIIIRFLLFVVSFTASSISNAIAYLLRGLISESSSGFADVLYDRLDRVWARNLTGSMVLDSTAREVVPLNLRRSYERLEIGDKVESLSNQTSNRLPLHQKTEMPPVSSNTTASELLYAMKHLEPEHGGTRRKVRITSADPNATLIQFKIQLSIIKLLIDKGHEVELNSFIRVLARSRAVGLRQNVRLITLTSSLQTSWQQMLRTKEELLEFKTEESTRVRSFLSHYDTLLHTIESFRKMLSLQSRSRLVAATEYKLDWYVIERKIALLVDEMANLWYRYVIFTIICTAFVWFYQSINCMPFDGCCAQVTGFWHQPVFRQQLRRHHQCALSSSPSTDDVSLSDDDSFASYSLFILGDRDNGCTAPGIVVSRSQATPSDRYWGSIGYSADDGKRLVRIDHVTGLVERFAATLSDLQQHSDSVMKAPDSIDKLGPEQIRPTLCRKAYTIDSFEHPVITKLICKRVHLSKLVQFRFK